MIPIRNVYYMLSYAFKILREKGYKNIATEEFENVPELMAEILIKGITYQIKCGLGRDYISQSEELAMLRGKIEITESIKRNSQTRNRMVCSFDEFSVNTYSNQIIKATVFKLFGLNVSGKRKKELRKLMLYFGDVDTLDLHSVNWNMNFGRNSQNYRLLITTCYLINKSLLQTTSDGRTKLMEFFDEQRMHAIYETFILEYYKKEHPEINANASKIEWMAVDGIKDNLPEMKTDIMLSKGNKVLIIDAKYYSHTMQERFSVKTIHSGNLYQVFAYVKNKDYELRGVDHEVAGMLLYAKTDEDVVPDNEYQMGENKISVKTLDLGLKFEEIKSQLDKIVEDYFD